jgi:hypothetical protein
MPTPIRVRSGPEGGWARIVIREPPLRPKSDLTLEIPHPPDNGDLGMAYINLLYDTCRDMFVDYSAAVSSVDDVCGTRSMVLMLRDGSHTSFFTLMCDLVESKPVYYIRPWRGRGTVGVKANDGTIVPDAIANAVIHGIPIPRDGSLFGWKNGTEITTLMVVYATYMPTHPEPSWSVMPRTDIGQALWPPFTGEPLFGDWFWRYLGDGRIISLDELIWNSPGAVFWVDMEFDFSRGCCAVAHKIMTRDGYTFGSGCYVYYQELKVGTPVPTLGELLADPRRIDLAPRFGVSPHQQFSAELRRQHSEGTHPRGPG